MSLIAAACVFGAALTGCLLWMWREDRHATTPDTLPRRTPGARRVIHGDPADWPETPTRDEHIDAVWALCAASPPYVESRLAAYEADFTRLAELLLELDDNSPRPGGGADGDRGYIPE